MRAQAVAQPGRQSSGAERVLAVEAYAAVRVMVPAASITSMEAFASGAVWLAEALGILPADELPAELRAALRGAT